MTLTLDMIRKPNRNRTYHWFGTARYKLPISVRVDRAIAADLLWEARAWRKRCKLRPSWRACVELAASWAHEEAGDDDTQLAVYDHLSYVLERLIDYKVRQ